ncbi:hypothetical protein [Asaia bogorensis]|uniref:hypothetical protein n=1 Tax=Asaia bogorensis TaxID=91915 RepID=UPI000EFD337E|nr:hypothetical protein [Asaia bogorensis]
MYQIDTNDAVTILPAPLAAGTPGYFDRGDPVAGRDATLLDSDYFNMQMMEAINLVQAAGLIPSKTAYNQMLLATRKLGLVGQWDGDFADAVNGYPAQSIVADPTTVGTYWISTADNNLTTPGAPNAAWQNLFTPVTSGRWLGTQMFTASGFYMPTPGTKQIILTLAGGGGSGGGSPANSSSQISVGSGGASGSFAKVILTSGFSAGVAITIGSGGLGVVNGGNPGGTTSFGSLIAVAGGGFGGTNQITSSTGAGISTTGPSGAIPIINAGRSLSQSGGSVGTNGQMWGTALVVMPGFGGSSPWGGGGSNIAGATGGNATGYAAGGGGTGDITGRAALAGGNGSPGFAEIQEYS